MLRDENISMNYKHPWISRTIRCLSCRKQCYFKRARQTNSPEHWSKHHKIKWNVEENVEIHIINLLATNLVSSSVKTVNKRLDYGLT